ncbi:hypothetical protein POM88_028205 [Heracleum sosnowskyi]|uniref:Uncharacterized protein n=1 Tax=Heracleum sosnowskyi TaxID=360622 RepID=A0AAD8IAG7_9APIA|nr:hypothetical protein POM88_028205 [Heracleum sosnowskyi]
MAEDSSDSVHTNDLFIDALPGTLTSVREDTRIHVDGGCVLSHSGPSTSSSHASGNSNEAQVIIHDSTRGLLNTENHLEIIHENKTRLDFAKFLENLGIPFDHFTAYQKESALATPELYDDPGITPIN